MCCMRSNGFLLFGYLCFGFFVYVFLFMFYVFLCVLCYSFILLFVFVDYLLFGAWFVVIWFNYPLLFYYVIMFFFYCLPLLFFMGLIEYSVIRLFCYSFIRHSTFDRFHIISNTFILLEFVRHNNELRPFFIVHMYTSTSFVLDFFGALFMVRTFTTLGRCLTYFQLMTGGRF